MASKAINIFNQIKDPNEVIVNLFFNACAQIGTEEALNLIIKVSSNIPQAFLSDSNLLSSLIDALMKCGNTVYAQSLFETSTMKTLSMYTAMMKGFIINNMADKAIKLFDDIKNPNEVTINLLFNACAQLGTAKELSLVKNVSSNIPKTFHQNPFIQTSLIDALMKCGDTLAAQSLFDTIKARNLFIYGAMMKGFIINNMASKAINIFNQVKNPDRVLYLLFFNACAQMGTEEALNLTKKVSSNIPQVFLSDPNLLSSLLDALAMCSDIKTAQSLFERSKIHTLSIYSVMMKGFIVNDMARKAIDIFNNIHKDEFQRENNQDKILNLSNKMKNEFSRSDITIYLCLIKALTDIGIFSIPQSMVQQIPSYYLSDYRIQNSLIINSYGLNGMSMQAVELFRKMPKEFIDESTYVCVLNACSHSGLVAIARSIFNNISIKTDIIYTTMIDCLSRAAIFDEAQQLIDQFEHHHMPVWSMYMALLSGARNEKNANLSQNIFDRMKKHFPELKSSLVSASILLSNVYASTGDHEKASNIRMELEKSGAKKKVGLSITEIDGKILQFRAHDQSHHRSTDIYIEADRISQELIEYGYKYDSSWITRPLQPDETIESVLCGHSERLAIAAHFIDNRKPKIIQITKNLRICGDCHRVTKIIAALRQCEIVVRDANRIHHFYTNGQCSCNDYF
ncbi:unnamed protein product [Rotaria magnacalcarata]|uniref:DYW domain-containing protein n=1 Tax=Rotaria magnacalcarata TaxID=392030 RepID=A0A816QR60_9BILA|nr:unnamed protein product [Rotaria magnacalcarata]CAF2072413.1 unnamed protein product [Rotaria magnacalcarata]CAF4251964.1 unnamed protein product [Rotaria magnacalcarata]CAF4257170.1 unnamed protein product [Rotaria magnacalcarata]